MTACRIDCETRYIVENCNCRMVHMPGERHGWYLGGVLSTRPVTEVFSKVAVLYVRINCDERPRIDMTSQY